MSSFDDVQTVWMSGELLPWAKANIHVSAHALHYGSGVFEGIRCYETPDRSARRSRPITSRAATCGRSFSWAAQLCRSIHGPVLWKPR